MNLYLTALEYIQDPSGQETASLVSNLTRVSSNMSVGATALPLVAATTANLNLYDNITIFDGSSSEVVTVAAAASAGATSVTISATAYVHNAGTVVCSDGGSGSLANSIRVASQRVETFCQQALLTTTYTETLPLRTLNASVTSDGYLHFRTRHFPITSVSALAIVLDAKTTITLDPTQCILNTRAMSVDVPIVSTILHNAQVLTALPPLTQLDPGWLQYTYIAGYSASALPWDIKQACTYFVSEIVSDRLNPTAAVSISMGKRHLTQYGKGVSTLENPYQIRAYELLTPYKRLV